MLFHKSYYPKTKTEVRLHFVKNPAKKHMMLYKQLLFRWMVLTSKMSMMKLKLSSLRMKMMEAYQMEWSMSISMKDSMNTAKKLSFI